MHSEQGQTPGESGKGESPPVANGRRERVSAAGGGSDPLETIRTMLEGWTRAVDDPGLAQNEVLDRLLPGYAATSDGHAHGAAAVTSLRDYRSAFPARSYRDFQPAIQRVMAGDVEHLLFEEPIGWAMTRGTTAEEPKIIPMTPTDLALRVHAARAMLNYVAQTRQRELLRGVNLNLNFPSVVGTIRAGNRDLEVGYSSGIYAKHVSASTPIRSLPTQADIDALGGGKTAADWERRFELAYHVCKDEDVTLVGGVAPTALKFGEHLRRVHGLYPKEVWSVRIMTLGSTPGINTRLQPALNAMYGPAALREIYGATEGMFGQQRDEKRAWVPNYDLFLFEVLIGRRIKMLHELRPGEWGRLIVSTPILPRYDIQDTVIAVRPPYFRCIGRAHWWTVPRYAWNELSSLNLGRL